MNRYKIPCTEEQTKKALELGAPLERRSDNYGQNRYFRFKLQNEKYGGTEYYYVECPTAEEMIGWLEDTIFEEINIQKFANFWEYNIFLKDNDDLMFIYGHYKSRTEATLAGIDVALEYLTNNK